MRTTLLSIIFAALAFLGAATFSYVYLSHTIGPLQTYQLSNTGTAPKTSVAPVGAVVQPKEAKTAATKSISAKIAPLQKVIAPGPLRITTQVRTGGDMPLSVYGVITYTNISRSENGGLAPLAENQTLDRDAELKIDDMFAKQYFEHVSPTGVGPAELADKVGYAYVLVGENLALGDFSSDQNLVTAWMNSPGHRANILNSRYQEIGVAVRRGIYEGRTTWLAVQSFGMPRSACPYTDDKLKAQIDINNANILTLRAALDAKKAQIEATSPSDPNYNTYANEFNALVPQYNALVETNRVDVINYNNSVRVYNDCINAASPHTAIP